MDKEQERWYLNRFATACPDFPPGEPISHENPDFLVESLSSMIGIELTRYFVRPAEGERPRQEQENLRSRIVSRAREVLASRDTRRLHVNVQFDFESNLHTRDIDRVAQYLAGSVEQSSVKQGSFEVIESDLPPEVLHVMVWRSKALTDSYWHADDIASTPEVSPEEVQAIIANKEPRLIDYRTSAEKNWLVIVADGSELSSHVDWPAQTLDHVYDSAFDRVYLFLNAHNRSIQLSISN